MIVPVLSEHIIVVLPRVSTAGSFLIIAFLLAMYPTPIARVMVMAAGNAAVAGANRNSIGQYNDYGYQAKLASDAYAGIATASFIEMSKRFKATAATQDAQFILTKLDDGVGLVKINKDTGKVDKEIVVKDKQPEYEVDDFGGFLYYKASSSSIFSYDLRN